MGAQLPQGQLSSTSTPPGDPAPPVAEQERDVAACVAVALHVVAVALVTVSVTWAEARTNCTRASSVV